MFENVSSEQKDDHFKDEYFEEFEHKPLLISIPKVEPICSSITNLNENILNEVSI